MVKRTKSKSVKFKPASRRLRMKDLRPGMVMNWVQARSYYGNAAISEVALELGPGESRLSFCVYTRHPRKKTERVFMRRWYVWHHHLKDLEFTGGPW